MRRLGALTAVVALWLWWLAGEAAAESLALTGASDRSTLIGGLVFAALFGLVAMRLRRN
jgi:LPXTG-motif cell wall-anchored protein